MPSIELLAPARDLACGLTAIDCGADCGADAVYIGAPRFVARAKAGNPLADIEELARHAHTYWAKVYVTVNTLLYDDELSQAMLAPPALRDRRGRSHSPGHGAAAAGRTRYCIRHQLGLCPRENDTPPLKEPLYLVDEDGHRYRLRFDCAACEMEVYF